MSDEIDNNYYKMVDLPEHRIYLFAFICNLYKSLSWKSKFSPDGIMYNGYFVAGINTPKGIYTYNCDLGYWSLFEIKELKVAPEWDGHLPSDIGRLFTLPKLKE